MAGTLVEDASDGDGDGLFHGQVSMYRRCALRAKPASDYARYRLGDQDDSLRFERLVLPLAADGGPRVTLLLGLAVFEGSPQA